MNAEELTLEEEFGSCFSYRLKDRKLDISGPKGNAFIVMGVATEFVKQVEGIEVSRRFFRYLRESSDYNELLRRVIRKTGITLVSPYELRGIDPDLYEIEESDYI